MHYAFFLLLQTFLQIYCEETLSEFRIGAFFPIYHQFGYDKGGHNRFAGFYTAVREINNKSDGIVDELLPNVTIRYTLFDTQRDTGTAFFAAFSAVEESFGGAGVHALVGAASSVTTESVALVGANAKVPQITYSATSSALSDDANYPYLMRTIASDDFQAKAMADLIHNTFQWASVATISATDTYSSYGISAFHAEAEDRGIKIGLAVTYITETTTILTELQSSAYKVVVLFVSANDGYSILLKAKELGMIGVDTGYMWIMSESLATTNRGDLEAALGDLLVGAVLLQPEKADGELYDSFESRMRSINSKLGDCPEQDYDSTLCQCSLEKDDDDQYLYVRDHDQDPSTPDRCVGIDFPNDEVNTYTPYTYDAVYVLAYAAHKLLLDGSSLDNGPLFFETLLNTSLILTTGFVEFGKGFGQRGERTKGIRYGVYNYDSSAELVEVGIWSAKDGFKAMESIELTYPTSDNSKPGATGTPVCEIGEILPAGSMSCLRCDVGTYSWDPGAIACLDCPTGAVCYGGAQVKALAGYWRFPNTTGVCDGDSCSLVECPVSLACEGEIYLTGGATLTMGSDTITFNALGDDARGLIQEYCFTSSHQTGNASCTVVLMGHEFVPKNSLSAVSEESLLLSKTHNNIAVGDITGTDLYLKWEEGCAAGYTGNLCSRCDATLNYGKSYTGICSQCPDSMMASWALALSGVLVFMIVGMAVIKMKVKKSVKIENRLPVILKIFMSYGQMTSIFLAFSFNWPISLEQFFGVQDVVFNAGAQLINWDCMMNTFQGAGREDATRVPKIFRQYLIWLSLPVLTVICSYCVWMFIYLWRVYDLKQNEWDYEYFRKRGLAHVASDGLIEAHEVKATLLGLGEDAGEVNVKEIIRLANIKEQPISVNQFQRKFVQTLKSIYYGDTILTVVILLFILYPSIAKIVFRVFTCEELYTDQYFLEDDLDTQCYTSLHITWQLALGLPGVLGYVIGIPLLGVYILHSQKSDLEEIHVKSRYGFLYDGYKQKYYLWETWVMARKVLMIIVAVFVSGYGKNSVAITGLVVVLLSAFLQYLCAPFDERDLNSLENKSLMTTLLTYVCGLYFLEESLTAGFYWSLILLVFIVNILFILKFLLLIKDEVSLLLLRAKVGLMELVAVNFARIKGDLTSSELKQKKKQYQDIYHLREAALVEAYHCESLLAAKIEVLSAQRQKLKMKEKLVKLEDLITEEKYFQNLEKMTTTFHSKHFNHNRSDRHLTATTEDSPLNDGQIHDDADCETTPILALYAKCTGKELLPPSHALKNARLLKKINQERKSCCECKCHTMGSPTAYSANVDLRGESKGLSHLSSEIPPDGPSFPEEPLRSRKVDIAAVLMTCLLLGIGSVVMQALELPNELLARDSFLEYEEYVKQTLKELAPVSNDTQHDEETFESFWANLQEYSDLKKEAPSIDNLSWDFNGATFFTVTIMTTIGYGSFSPKTDEGKIWTIFFSIVGIPCFCFTLSTVSRYFAALIHLISDAAATRRSNKSKIAGATHWKSLQFCNRKTIILISVGAACFMIVLIFAKIFDHLYVGWTFFDSLYFNIITLSTVGFGDFVPTLESEPARVAFAFYILTGLSVVGTFLGILQDCIAGATDRVFLKKTPRHSRGRDSESFSSMSSPSARPVQISRRRSLNLVSNAGNFDDF